MKSMLLDSLPTNYSYSKQTLVRCKCPILPTPPQPACCFFTPSTSKQQQQQHNPHLNVDPRPSLPKDVPMWSGGLASSDGRLISGGDEKSHRHPADACVCCGTHHCRMKGLALTGGVAHAHSPPTRGFRGPGEGLLDVARTPPGWGFFFIVYHSK